MAEARHLGELQHSRPLGRHEQVCASLDGKKETDLVLLAPVKLAVEVVGHEQR